MALGLLVTFRTNTAHNRYVEARVLWGTGINVCRDISSVLLARTSSAAVELVVARAPSQTTVTGPQESTPQHEARLQAQPPEVRRAIKLVQVVANVARTAPWAVRRDGAGRAGTRHWAPTISNTCILSRLFGRHLCTR